MIQQTIFAQTQVQLFARAICTHQLNQRKAELIVDTLDSSSKSKMINSQIQDKGRFPLDSTKLGIESIKKASKRKAIMDSIESYKNGIERQLIKTLQQCIASSPPMGDTQLQQRFNVIEQVFEVFLDGTEQCSPQTFSFIAKYAWDASANHGNNDYVLNIGIGGNQIPPPYIESYLVKPLSILKKLNELKKQGKLFFLPALCLLFSYPTQIIECDYDNQGRKIRPLLHYHTALVTISRLHRFVALFFPEIKDRLYFHGFPAYQRYSVPRITFAILSQCIDPIALKKLFIIKGSLIDLEREQNDLIYNAIGNYNAYVGRHLVSTFMLSQSHTLRFGSAFTETQFHASSSTLLQYLWTNNSQIEQKIADITLGLIENFSAQDRECNDWSDRDIYLNNFKQIKEQLTYQFSNLPPQSKIYSQIGIPSHASYLQHPGECSLSNLVKHRRFSADALEQQNRTDKAKKLAQSFSSVIAAIGFDNYLNFLTLWANQYKSYDIEDAALLQAFCSRQEIVQSILCPQEETRELLNYHLF